VIRLQAHPERITPGPTPFEELGGGEAVQALADAFYDAMEAHEPALTALHERDTAGKVTRGARDRFGMFLAFWLGGPQDYLHQHGHPRLRMRHGHLPVDTRMRDAWLGSMARALDARGIRGAVRTVLEDRFAAAAEMLRNVDEPPGTGPR
jgi:hemoglobin